jgi:hypothetical protein
VEARPAQQERHAEREQQVGEDGAGERGAHHVEQPRAQRDHGDDQLGGIAEGRVEQPAERVARVGRELLGRAHDEARDRHDRERRAQEHPGRRRAGVLHRERDRDHRQQPLIEGLMLIGCSSRRPGRGAGDALHQLPLSTRCSAVRAA